MLYEFERFFPFFWPVFVIFFSKFKKGPKWSFFGFFCINYPYPFRFFKCEHMAPHFWNPKLWKKVVPPYSSTSPLFIFVIFFKIIFFCDFLFFRNSIFYKFFFITLQIFFYFLFLWIFFYKVINFFINFFLFL